MGTRPECWEWAIATHRVGRGGCWRPAPTTAGTITWAGRAKTEARTGGPAPVLWGTAPDTNWGAAWMLEAGTDNGGNHYLGWSSNNGATHGVASPSTLATGTWHQVVGTFDGATWKMYLDGAANGSSADATAPVNTGDDVVAGGLSTNGFGTIFVFNGLLDELRVSNTARSSDWIATEHNNQSNPGNFLIVGTIQTAP